MAARKDVDIVNLTKNKNLTVKMPPKVKSIRGHQTQSNHRIYKLPIVYLDKAFEDPKVMQNESPFYQKMEHLLLFLSKNNKERNVKKPNHK